MKVAVTGATGFVGSNVSRVLALAGHEVIGFARREGESYISWDITKGPLAGKYDVDAVVHCAARVDDWSPYKVAYEGNVVGTKNVLNSFPTARFIHMSSASVYDPFSKAPVLSEDSPCGNHLNAYSQTKREAEQAVEKSQQDVRIILRPHIVYGPGDTTVLPRLLKARRFGRFLILGNGRNHISVTHIENLCAAVLRALEAPLRGCQTFNIADDVQGTIDELILSLEDSLRLTDPLLHIPRLVAYALGASLETAYRIVGIRHPPLITRYAVAQMAYGHALDISKAKRVLGYSPKMDFRNGLSEIKLY